MLGESRQNINSAENKAKIALRDAAVIFVFTLVSLLLNYGYPPDEKVVYTSLLTALLTGIVSYMHAMGIKKPEDA